MRGPHRVGRLKELGQRPRFDKVVELLVGEIVRAQGFAAEPFGVVEPRHQIVDRVHRARIVDVVGRDQRGVERARTCRVQHLEQEIRRVGVPCQDAVDPEILRAGGRAQIFPLRLFGIGGRLFGIGADMAKAARHADAVGPHQILRQIVVRVVVKALRVPALGRRLVECRVGEQAQPENAGRLAVIGAGGDVLAARADRHTRIFCRVGERVGRAVRVALVEPQPVMLGVGAGGLGKARLVDQPEIIPAIVAAVFEAGIGREDLQAGRTSRRSDWSACPTAGRRRRSRRATCCGP